MHTTIATIYLIVLLIAFFCSLISFRLHYPLHLKFFSIFLGLTVFIEFVATFILPRLNFDSNYSAYNSFFLIQLVSLGYYFYLLTRSPFFKKTIILLIVVYSVFWICNTLIIYTNFKEPYWNSYGAMVGDLFIIIFVSRYLFELLTGTELISLKKSSEFWIATGILLFCSCELPITGIMNFLVKDPILTRKLVKILQVLNISMYLIFIYAYLCRIKPTMKKSLS